MAKEHNAFSELKDRDFFEYLVDIQNSKLNISIKEYINKEKSYPIIVLSPAISLRSQKSVKSLVMTPWP